LKREGKNQETGKIPKYVIDKLLEEVGMENNQEFSFDDFMSIVYGK